MKWIRGNPQELSFFKASGLSKWEELEGQKIRISPPRLARHWNLVGNTCELHIGVSGSEVDTFFMFADFTHAAAGQLVTERLNLDSIDVQSIKAVTDSTEYLFELESDASRVRCFEASLIEEIANAPLRVSHEC